MKKKRKTISSSATKRVPPSVPKCVRKTASGYETNVLTALGKDAVKFTFIKSDTGYRVIRTTVATGQSVDMARDTAVAPATRHLFSNTSTLKAAIAAVEEWLGAALPDIR